MKWLIEKWPYVGAMAGIMLLIVLLATSPTPEQYLGWLFWMHLPVYMAHQVEEYIWPGRLIESLNSLLTRDETVDEPLTPAGAFVINVVVVWGGILLGALLYPKTPALAVGMIGVTAVNGIVHLGNLISRRCYNPGVCTAVSLQLPFSMFVFVKLLAAGMIGVIGLLLSLGFGLLVHGVIMGYFMRKIRR